MSKNTLLFIENVAIWSGVLLAYVVVILPLIQLLAAFAALVFSILSIIRILKKWHEKNSNY